MNNISVFQYNKIMLMSAAVKLENGSTMTTKNNDDQSEICPMMSWI